MTRFTGNAQAVLLVVQYAMGLSLICFLGAWYVRTKNKPLHKLLGILGVLSNVTAVLCLLVGIHILGLRIASQYNSGWVLCHRIGASFSFILMWAMLYSGIANKRELHMQLHKLFLFSYGLIYFSGYILFVR